MYNVCIIGLDLYKVRPAIIEHLVEINLEAQLRRGEVLEQDLCNYRNRRNVSHYLQTWSFPYRNKLFTNHFGQHKATVTGHTYIYTMI